MLIDGDSLFEIEADFEADSLALGLSVDDGDKLGEPEIDGDSDADGLSEEDGEEDGVLDGVLDGLADKETDWEGDLDDDSASSPVFTTYQGSVPTSRYSNLNAWAGGSSSDKRLSNILILVLAFLCLVIFTS